jgi:hypothetical protein
VQPGQLLGQYLLGQCGVAASQDGQRLGGDAKARVVRLEALGTHQDEVFVVPARKDHIRIVE